MSTNKPLLTLLLFLAPFWVLAQSIKGTVIDEEGTPLPFATIYVYETGSGSITNENGRYEIKLDPGSYNIAFQYLGHQSQKIAVEMTNASIQKDIIMPAQAYLLNEAQIKGNGKEDPSYTVIRKAIAKSSYHRQQVENYTCEVYVKGGGKLVSVPWFLESALEEEGIDTSLTFVTESVSEITYTRPGTYDEKVISIRTTGDSRNTNPMQYINSSFYDPKVGGIISPLSPKAFGYYKFKYVRTFEDRGYQINEIKVIPRSVGEDVVSGSLFIVEDLWCLHSLNLKTTMQGIDLSVGQVYAPVAETAWMPVSHVFKGEGKFFGVGFEFQYLATVSKYIVELNKDLDAEFVLLDEKTDLEEVEELKEERKISKSEKDLAATEAKLQEGEELTRKDLRKLLRDYEKQERKQEEEPEVMETRKVQIDSLAYESDSAYWALKRPIPLTASESKGYTYQDSLAIYAEKRAEGDTLGIGTQKFRVKDLVLGSRYDLGNDNYLRIVPAWAGIQFNTVDGWNAEYNVKYLKRFDKSRRLEISPLIRYGFKREKVSWKVDSEYKYGQGLHTGSVAFNGGQYYSQFNQNDPIIPLVNSLYSLFVEENFMKVYDMNYGEVKWGHEITHNIKLNVDASYAERIQTFNSTSQVWFPQDKKYTPNAPNNLELPNTDFGRSVAFKTNIGFEWQPGLKHNKSGDNYYAVNSPPKIIINYETATPGVIDSDIDYDLITAELQYTFDFNLLGKLGFSTKAGKYLSSKNMDFPDYQHFQGNQTILTRMDQMAGYAMLPYYDYSTSDEFVRTYVNYQFRQFLITSIPMIRLMGIKENININHLYTPTMNNYMEVSYSVDNIFRFVRLDFTANFIDGKYEDFMFQIGITSDMISFN